MNLSCQLLYEGFGTPPDPPESTFSVTSTAQILMFSGSAHSQVDGKRIGVRLLIDGDVKAQSCMHANTKFNRMALPVAMVPLSLTVAPETHTITIDRDPDYPDTRTDGEDFFSVSIAELDQSTTV